MFRTELTIAPQERLLPRTARVLTVGSCFADSIGERLRLNKISTLVNPFGTVFQPLALAQLLRAAAGEEQDWQQHVVEARGRWQSYDFHSTIGAESPVELLQTIQETVGRVGEFIRTADTVVLTLGTAWVYRLRETGELVSNLHKLPASLFEKELLTADEIVNSLAEVHALLRRVNPDIRIVLTVSPVRHIKDTLPLNAVSKSVLRVACHYLSELLPNVSYFPAYELLTDDLRDYRFYAADMLHPSEAAEDYIWERFARTYFDADFGRFRKEWAAVRQSLGHRPLYAGAPEHRTFLDQTRERLERLSTQGVDVKQELRDVQRQLASLPPPRPARLPEAEPVDDEERIDIGGDAPETVVHSASANDLADSNPRNERRSDNRRDNNRRNDRSGRDRRDSRPAPVVETVASESIPVEELVSQEPILALASAPSEPETEVTAQEEATDYQAKKKKRRSRGGAKRTARKNAARLAAGQELDEIDAGEAEDTELGEQTDLEAVEASNSVPTQDFAEPAQVTESASETAIADVPASLAEAAATNPQLNQTRKRGTGPTPKKSKVITKSGLVKRGQRGSLYRTAAPTPDETAMPNSATAPIISPPIIPEILLERPANDFADFQQPTAEPDLAATVLGLYSSKPKAPVATPQPKRGRPKTAVAPVVAPASPQPVAPATPEPADTIVAETAVAVPAATIEPAPAKTTAKKPATHSAKATKPAAKKTATAAKPAVPKKATAKPAATRRGRPPGKNSPPEAETPAT